MDQRMNECLMAFLQPHWTFSRVNKEEVCSHDSSGPGYWTWTSHGCDLAAWLHKTCRKFQKGLRFLICWIVERAGRRYTYCRCLWSILVKRYVLHSLILSHYLSPVKGMWFSVVIFLELLEWRGQVFNSHELSVLWMNLIFKRFLF